MAGYEEDKPAAELLRRSLASAAGATDDCPDPEILAAYAERSLDADEASRWNLHFSQCGYSKSARNTWRLVPRVVWTGKG